VVPPAPLPTFLIIGAPKSGTTSLAAYLDAHPGVFMSPVKEIHFFDDHFAEGLDWYREHFAGAADASAIGEASPTYLLRSDAHARMASVLPDARLIAVLRNPVDAAWSNYLFQRSLGFESKPFLDAVHAELADRRSVRTRYVEGGRYLEQIRRLLEHYPREALLVLLFEDLTARPREAFAEVCRFIGADPVIVPSNVGQVYNPSTKLRSERLRRAMLRGRAWKRFGHTIPSAIDRWNRREVRPRPIEDAARAELSAIFAGDNRALGELLGRDLSAWNR
jgi:hypothetical protein